MTKAQYEVFTLRLFNLACNIGLRPAARALGVSENKAMKIASRRKWNMRTLSPAMHNREMRPSDALLAAEVSKGIEETTNLVQHYGNRAKIAATISGARALEHLAQESAKTLVEPRSAISGEQWTKAVDRAAGWSAERAKGAVVNIALVQPPSPAEVEERKRADAILDAFTKRLMIENNPSS